MNLSLEQFLVEMREANATLNAYNGLLTLESGDTLDVEEALKAVCAERSILVNKLVAHCGNNIWGAHPDFPRDAWTNDVLTGKTLLGYWDWVISEAEEAGVTLFSDEVAPPIQNQMDVRYAIYLESATALKWPIKSYDEWLNS